MAERKPYVSDASSAGELESANLNAEPEQRIYLNHDAMLSLCWEGDIDRVQGLYRAVYPQLLRLELGIGTPLPNPAETCNFPTLQDVKRWLESLPVSTDNNDIQDDINFVSVIATICELRLPVDFVESVKKEYDN